MPRKVRRKKPKGPPVFTTEGPAHYHEAYQQNRRFATGGNYTTDLSKRGERRFERWVDREDIPFDVDAKHSDYDMRGYFKKFGGVNYDRGTHFVDTFKTPYDTSFSSESKYATNKNPYVWQNNRLVDKRSGKVIFRSRGGE